MVREAASCRVNRIRYLMIVSTSRMMDGPNVRSRNAKAVRDQAVVHSFRMPQTRIVGVMNILSSPTTVLLNC